MQNETYLLYRLHIYCIYARIPRKMQYAVPSLGGVTF
jgi:hypothetical protein